MKYYKKRANAMASKTEASKTGPNVMGPTGPSAKINNTLLLKEYIKALIQNVDDHNFPKEMNLIFDGGIFN